MGLEKVVCLILNAESLTDPKAMFPGYKEVAPNFGTPPQLPAPSLPPQSPLMIYCERCFSSDIRPNSVRKPNRFLSSQL